MIRSLAERSTGYDPDRNRFTSILAELGMMALFTGYYANNRPMQYFDQIILPAFVY